jgi:hypothetical protein
VRGFVLWPAALATAHTAAGVYLAPPREPDDLLELERWPGLDPQAGLEPELAPRKQRSSIQARGGAS